MRLLCDEHGGVLDVFFAAHESEVAKAVYELRKGIVHYLTAKMLPAQLTLVNYHRLTQLPAIHFDELAAHCAQIRKKLLRVVSTPLSAILRIDPKTNYGQIMSPALLDVCVA